MGGDTAPKVNGSPPIIKIRNNIMSPKNLIQYDCVIIRQIKNGFIIEGHINSPRSIDQWVAKTIEECHEVSNSLISKIKQ